MSFRFEGRAVLFATRNLNKFNEARAVLAEFDIAVGMIRVKRLEVQSDSLEEIARNSALDAFKKCHMPLIVEDAGLFVDTLSGFPGPYSAYVYRTIGNEGLLRILNGKPDRRARFESVVAHYSPPTRELLCFSGKVYGEIAYEAAKGASCDSFGFDPIFCPAHEGKTFAEMSIHQKNSCSHRAKALRSFGQWYKKNY